MSEAARPIYTVGHSTRALDQFLALLSAHRIEQLADVRTIPRSRRHPHFSGDQLRVSLAAAGIAYRHFPELGGLRKPRRDSRNTAWRHPGFRGYADYMETPAFEAGLQGLIDHAAGPGWLPTAVMCAEARWWQCHRQLIADALTARHIPVLHIMAPAEVRAHTLTDFAEVVGGRVAYRRLI